MWQLNRKQSIFIPIRYHSALYPVEVYNGQRHKKVLCNWKGNAVFLFSKDDMIYNKELGISEDDISVEDDLQTLAYWRDALNAQLTSILNRFGVDNSHQLPPSAKTAYRFAYTLERMARKRYGSLRIDIAVANGYVHPSEMRKARHFASKFMEVAKRELPSEEYLRILQISKDEIKSNMEK